MEVRIYDQLKISNRFAALENLDDSATINCSSNNIRTQKSQLKKVCISTNGSSIQHGLMNNNQTLSIKRSSLHCSGCMIQATLMQIICILSDVKLVDIAETNSGNCGQVKLMNLKQTVRTKY